jgi:hypothetical protein
MKEDLKIHKVELPVVPAVEKLSVDCSFARKDA